MKSSLLPDSSRAPGRLRPVLAFAPALVAAALALLPASGLAATATPPAPAVDTSGASNVSFSSAILYGYVNAEGAATNYVFQYGPTTAYGAQSPLSPAGNGTISIKVSQTIAGLQAATIYHYRVVAISPSGTTVGKDRTFTTGKIPLSVQLVATPNPVEFGNPFFVEGTLSGTGAANHAILLQANPFPYLGGFKTVGNAELTNASGGFSFPYLGLLENAQLRVVTVGSPVVASSVVTETVAVRAVAHVRGAKRRGLRAYLRHGRPGAGRRAGRLSAAQARPRLDQSGWHGRESGQRNGLELQRLHAPASSRSLPRADQGHKRRRARVELQRADPDPLISGVERTLQPLEHAHDAQPAVPVRARGGSGADAFNEVLALQPQRLGVGDLRG